jgi:2-keto-4-pentenoate hydratase
MDDRAVSDDAESWEIARRLVRARLRAEAVPVYPGALPPSLDAGYASQDAAIALWPSAIAGWKVGKIPLVWEHRLGEERLVGPIFADAVQTPASGSAGVFAAIKGGFAAVEAEFVFRISADAPVGRTAWTDDEALMMADALFVGAELAGSPLPAINELGPCVVVSDFGNNAGLILGPEISNWRRIADSALPCETWIDGVCVGSGRASDIAGGLAAALRFALGRCARRGMPLRKGQLVSTGAATGIHEIRAGQTARVVFPGIGAIEVRVEQASARSAA